MYSTCIRFIDFGERGRERCGVEKLVAKIFFFVDQDSDSAYLQWLDPDPLQH
jgi:hypothetical protein